ncbi:MAG: peptide MFS transporter [Holophagaceae bacterium]
MISTRFSSDTSGIAGHPKGLMVLFFTEMWERFSYYGMRALLMLYMIAPQESGGLGFTKGYAGLIYGIYTFSVYGFSIPGGWIADRYTGYRKAVIIGGLLIALGQGCLALGNESFFYVGLLGLVLGTSFLKTNCSTMVGQLYADNDSRRDAGFSIYYMGINLGALIAPLICGYFAQDPRFLSALDAVGLSSRSGWSWGFGAAGIAMFLGVLQFYIQQDKLGSVGLKTGVYLDQKEGKHLPPLTDDEKSRMWVVGILMFFIMTFFFLFEQAGTTLNLFALENTKNEYFGISFPSSWFQSVNSIWLLILAPIFSWFWIRLGPKEPSSPIKFAWGLLFVGLGMLLLVLPSQYIALEPGMKVSPNWLILTYMLHTVGELCLSPVGLSTTTKLAPARYAGIMMGLFFFAIGAGNLLAGLVVPFSERLAPTTLFFGLFLITIAMAGVLLILNPIIKKMMAGVR